MMLNSASTPKTEIISPWEKLKLMVHLFWLSTKWLHRVNCRAEVLFSIFIDDLLYLKFPKISKDISFVTTNLP